ncbi:very short patch repair endonuclease [Mucilaginibacter achroorhodeus]|uniref:Very short patch repair endonuclease n=1 Tax=Mucilaginibacter achroorhodeus TaxID=2599294 RepID=A0A563TXD1_9SPHI|nr:very short patch repair endonuclease [Mucilaginibacter achroorhodeus]TWR24004.1 very short patch repair endonuclease [Mucilaginibacter achroorhodeus]
MGDTETEKIKVPRFEKRYGFSTTEKRSRLMSKIKGKNTTPEVLIRKALTAVNVRYRLHNKGLPGNPDISSKKYRLAIFIDGEFWHGFNWQIKKNKIATNRAFWIPKIERNMQRDEENNKRLGELGYTVFRFWDREIKTDLEACVTRVVNYIRALKKVDEL